MTTIKNQHGGLRAWTSVTLSTGCVALLFLPGCKQQVQQQKQQPGQQASTQDLKSEAASAGQELKASMKEIQETVGGDHSTDSGPIVNLNYASLGQLATLPGISKEQAKTIMNNRPYNTPLDLVYKKVVTQEEYDRLLNRVVTWDNLWTKPD